MTPGEGRKFALTVGGAFIALAGLMVWRGHLRLAVVAGALGVLLVLAGLVIPARLGPVYRAWMKLAELISRVTTPVFMGVMYYLVIAPSGFLMRTFGSNPIRRAQDSPSYWVRREKRRSDLTRQF